MRLPKSVNVCGHTYKIIVRKDGTLKIPNAWGTCSPSKKEIEINAAIPKDRIVRVLLHEIRHAYQTESGLSQLLCDELAEVDAEGFASLVTSIFDVKLKTKRAA